MTILESEISRLEEIQKIMDKLLIEAEELVANTNDYTIQNVAVNGWISKIKNALQSHEDSDMTATISELWDELHRDKIL